MSIRWLEAQLADPHGPPIDVQATALIKERSCDEQERASLMEPSSGAQGQVPLRKPFCDVHGRAPVTRPSRNLRAMCKDRPHRTSRPSPTKKSCDAKESCTSHEPHPGIDFPASLNILPKLCRANHAKNPNRNSNASLCNAHGRCTSRNESLAEASSSTGFHPNFGAHHKENPHFDAIPDFAPRPISPKKTQVRYGCIKFQW